MKCKVTKKEVRNNYYKILSVGYCDLQHLLKYKNPFGYSTRAEGWACDYYDIDGVCISTGYSPLNSKNVVDDYKMQREYDGKARELSTREELDDLLKKFMDKVNSTN